MHICPFGGINVLTVATLDMPVGAAFAVLPSERPHHAGTVEDAIITGGHIGRGTLGAGDAGDTTISGNKESHPCQSYFLGLAVAMLYSPSIISISS